MHYTIIWILNESRFKSEVDQITLYVYGQMMMHGHEMTVKLVNGIRTDQMGIGRAYDNISWKLVMMK